MNGRCIDSTLFLSQLPAEKRQGDLEKFAQISSASPDQQMAWLLEQMFPNQTGKEFFLARISADGIPRDYRTAEGFAQMIEGYEKKVLAAYSQLTTSRHIDPARVFLTGFSIGGDLSWAIALRNPGKLRGRLC